MTHDMAIELDKQKTLKALLKKACVLEGEPFEAYNIREEWYYELMRYVPVYKIENGEFYYWHHGKWEVSESWYYLKQDGWTLRPVMYFPLDDEGFFYVGIDGNIVLMCGDDDEPTLRRHLIRMGNAFKSRMEAKRNAKRILRWYSSVEYIVSDDIHSTFKDEFRLWDRERGDVHE